MQNKLSSKIYTTLRSWELHERNDWLIKLSIYDEENILLIFISKVTGQTFVRYFTCEDEAVKFINFIINKN